MADPIVHITGGIPDSGTGNITTLGQTIPPAGTSTASVQGGHMAQGAVTTAAPAYTNGQVNPLSLTTTGLLRVDNSGVTQPVSGTFWQATQPVSGTITANQGGTWNVGITGTATITGTVTANQGGAPWTIKPDGTAWAMTSTSANVNVTNASIPITGTITANQGGTWNITNISGTVSLPTGASTSALQPTNAAQGSTTTGQTGHLAMGAVTTGNPTYVTAQTSPLSLDTSGALRVNVIAGSGGGGTSSSFGSAFPATGTAIGGEYLSSPPTLTTGQMVALQTNVSGALKVDGSAVTQPVSGTISVSGTVGVTQSTSPWVVSLTSTTITGTVACTQSGTWNIGTITTLPALPANQSVNVSQINGVTPLMGNGVTGTGSQRVTIASDNTAFTVNAAQSGSWNINNISGIVNLPSGAATSAKQPALGTAGSASTDVITVQGIASGTPLSVQRVQTAANTGLTQTRVVAAATTNATSLKASAGNIAAIDLFNVAAYMVFLKLYNKASAPTVGTDTPVWTIPLPASGGFSIDFSQGEYFSTGIAFAITKLQADGDTTALVAGDVTGRIKWV